MFFVFQNIKDLLSNLSNGTTLKNITQDMMINHQIVIPEDDILEKFNKLVFPMIQNIENNINQSQNIAEIRDKLLPKLMRGEIVV